MSGDKRIARAKDVYEQAVFGGDTGGLAKAERDLDGVEADLALARGRILHARYFEQKTEDPRELELFQRAAELYQKAGDVRGEGEAQFWIGVVHQFIRRDNGTAVPALTKAAELARQAGDKSTLAYAFRHLGIAEHSQGHLNGARAFLGESTRLRREIGLLAGVAANLVGLTYITAAEGDRDAALALIEEARTLAEASGAFGILPSIEEARATL